MSDLSVVERANGGKGKLPWTPRAQAVLEHAQEQAHREGADVTGSEHVLFGIISVKGCLGATILKNLGADVAGRLESRESPAQKGTGKAALGEDIDKMIQCACEQAGEWGHEYIGAEHLLAGILLARAGKGFQILSDLGITLEKVREETTKLIVCQR